MIENFIGIYEDVLDGLECQHMIDYFEIINQQNMVISQEQYTSAPAHLTRKDDTVFMLYPNVVAFPATLPILEPFVNKFWKIYSEQYANEFTVLRSTVKHGFHMLRLQKTPIGGGFHTWHYENFNLETSSRLVTFQLYLNDVDDGGETEFLYFHKRYKPKAGTLLIWPSTYSHTHRGNPPLSNSKYIITGWLTFFE
jgi:hypothetical protein